MAADPREIPSFRIQPPNRLTLHFDPQTEINVAIPSTSRADCYAPAILSTLLNIYREMQVQAQTIAVQAQASASSMPSNLLPIADIPTLQMNRQNILANCASYLVDFFDPQIMIYQNRDIDGYRANISLTDRELDRLSVEEAHNQFDQYLRHRAIKAGTYAKYMHATYPNINNFLQRIGTNFYNNTLQAIQRIQNDINLLRHDLLKNLGEPITLLNIHFTNSDLHKQGQQVLILEFANNLNVKKFVVYKPSSVLADAFLVGDMQRLANIDHNFSECSSLLNIFNRHLNESREHPPLPTYLIIPRLEGDPDKIRSHYGYLEYVTHQPWQEINYMHMLQESLKVLPPNMRGRNESAQEAVKKHFASFLSVAARDLECDFIARTQEEVNIYSRDCGLLLALLVCIGGTDLHCENMIIHRRRPILIDLEACFTLSGLTPAATACFDHLFGALMQSSASHESVRCLFDINGIEQKTIIHLQKNRMFHLLAQIGNQLRTCQPDRKLLLEGYELGLKLIAANKSGLLNWIKNIERFNIPVRVIPYATNVFRDEMKSISENNFSVSEFVDIRAQHLINDSQDYEHGIQQYQQADPQARIFLEVPLPFYAIYLNNDSNTGICSEYVAFNIPYYYTRVNERSLCDFNDLIVQVPLHILTPSQISGEEPLLELTVNFFPDQSSRFIRDRLETISDSPELRRAMVEQAAKDSEELTKSSPNPEALTVINIAHASSSSEIRQVQRPAVKQPQSIHALPEQVSASEDTPLVPKNNDKGEDDNDSERCGCRLM